MNEETARRQVEMVRDWEQRGHPLSACTGHTYPGRHCPAPQVHADVFPPEDALTFTGTLQALREIYADMARCRSGGDEWAMEWLGESWPALVPLKLRAAAGDPDAAEELREASHD